MMLLFGSVFCSFLFKHNTAYEMRISDWSSDVCSTDLTGDPAEAERWFEQFEGAGLDGVVAKPLDAPYTQNGRTMFKIKHARTADVRSEVRRVGKVCVSPCRSR